MKVRPESSMAVKFFLYIGAAITWAALNVETASAGTVNMECSYYKFAFNNNIILKDTVDSLWKYDVDWKPFSCGDDGEVTIDYPIASCLWRSSYEVRARARFLGKKAFVQQELKWRKVGELKWEEIINPEVEDGIWKIVGRRVTPSNQEFLLLFEITSLKAYSFDAKREQFKESYSLKGGDGETDTFVVNSVYDCK